MWYVISIRLEVVVWDIIEQWPPTRSVDQGCSEGPGGELSLMDRDMDDGPQFLE